MSNPYQPSSIEHREVETADQPRAIAIIVSLVLLSQVVVGIFGDFIPINARVIPRFGSILLLNPLIFLGFYLHTPTRKLLLVAAYMLFIVGVLNGILYARQLRVPVVKNTYIVTDLSSWSWLVALSILNIILAGVLLIRRPK